MPKYIALIQAAATEYECAWRELPADVRQEICAAQWRETPYLEPFDGWKLSRQSYVWQELIAELIEHHRPNAKPAEAVLRAREAFLSAIEGHALAWSEKQAEDDYDAEFDKESTSREGAPVPLSDFLDVASFNAERV